MPKCIPKPVQAKTQEEKADKETVDGHSETRHSVTESSNLISVAFSNDLEMLLTLQG